MTREEAFNEINRTQDDYVNQLVHFMDDPINQSMKTINFTSATGTGKTKMMAKLINKFPDRYFIVTSLSRGHLHLQIRTALQADCPYGNFDVYGLMDYKINSKLTADDIMQQIPSDKECIWLRDEGHVETNRFEELLAKVCYKVINFSATNQYSDIRCNFAHTMMLRIVNQQTGTPEDAIEKLMQIKRAHSNVSGYNPCAIFRCISANQELYDRIIQACKQHGLECIDISDEAFDMADLCQDDNKYDVIINKFKIVEGIDIRRAHVLYMDNQPANDATTIQIIGRCRRNALLYRNDIDILALHNHALLESTRECFVFYNVKEMKVGTDADGELSYAFCPYISCEKLKVGAFIEVINGQLPNGLHVQELQGQTGRFTITVDEKTGFNIVTPDTDFYQTIVRKPIEYLYVRVYGSADHIYKKIHINNISKLILCGTGNNLNWYNLSEQHQKIDNRTIDVRILTTLKKDFEDKMDMVRKNIRTKIKIIPIAQLLESITLKNTESSIQKYIEEHQSTYDLIQEILNFEKRPYRNEHIRLADVKGTFDEKIKKYLLYYCMRTYDTQSPEWEKYQYSLDNRLYFITSKRDYAIDVLMKLNIPREDTVDILKTIALCFSNKMPRVYTNAEELFEWNSFPKFTVKMIYGKKSRAYKADIAEYFKNIDVFLQGLNLVYNDAEPEDLIAEIVNKLNATYCNFNKNIADVIDIDCSPLYELLTKTELQKIDSGEIAVTQHMPRQKLLQLQVYNHGTIMNDRESAIIGVDKFKLIKPGRGELPVWMEARAVTSKLNSYNKLNAFISQKYSQELLSVKEYLFHGKNEFQFDKRCNSMIGYCVEYYSKYKVYGKGYLEEYIQQAMCEKNAPHDSSETDAIIVRACMLKYRAMMKRSFGEALEKVIRAASIASLLSKKYQDFIRLVILLGNKTASFVLQTLYKDRQAVDCVDPDLSICHITALADYITEDTILDIKVTNRIDESHIKQVLSYHYLSTKRSDLHIRRVIVYDATSGRSITISITPQNCADNAYEEWENKNVSL